MHAFEQLLPGVLDDADLLEQSPSDCGRSPLAVDLASESGAQLARCLLAPQKLRHLDTSTLAPRLRDMVGALRANARSIEFPALRGLERGTAERLLTHLYIQWCSAGTGRVDERRDAPKRAQVATTMHAIHFQISGRAFRQPGLRYTREEEHDLATFGHITERTEHRLLTSRSAALEPWDVVNQSGSGMLSMVRKNDLTTRLAHAQLIAMRTSSMEPPLLAVVQRLRLEADGSLTVGVRLVKGETRGAAVRALADPTPKYERALIIDADKERDIPAQLIVPPGKFALGASFELHAGRTEKVQVTAILEHCSDHDRISYQPA
jgi:hypothetical protein